MYAFVEFYNNFDADIAMYAACTVIILCPSNEDSFHVYRCMDGMKLNGVQLQIRRPKNYTPTMTTKVILLFRSGGGDIDRFMFAGRSFCFCF